MALNNRPPAPKGIKIKNTPLIQLYRRNNPACEICRLEGHYVTDIELHHIIPGIGRTDELWNLISLCHNHHVESTTHVTEDAIVNNWTNFAYKHVKGEITESKLTDLGYQQEVMKLVPEMRIIYNKAYGIKE